MRKLIKNNKSKMYVIQEMVTTEKSYLKGLEWLAKWKKELSENNILNDNEITELFSNVFDNIVKLSQTFYEDITKRYESWSSESEVGDIYLKILPFFKLYTDYCNNNDKAGKTLTKLMDKNKKFKEYILQEEKKAGLTFESYLITPIQRIPRYEMLLNTALKYTNKNKSDYEKLKKAADLVHEV